MPNSNKESFNQTRTFGWPTAILVLAPAEGWKGPSGPAENLWPHLIYSSLEGFRKFLEKSDAQTHRRTDAQTDRQTHKAAFNLKPPLGQGVALRELGLRPRGGGK